MSQFIKQAFYKQRADFQKDLPARDKKYTLCSGVTELEDIPYAEDGLPAHRLDLYQPENAADQKLPVILNVHGGGLLLGCKEFNRYFCAKLSRLGYLVYSIEYRLVPDCLFFDQCSDVFLAMEYIRKDLAQRGLTQQIYAVGDSGGACLLTYCAAMQNSQKVAAAAHVTPSALPIQALGLISGMFYTNKPDKIGLFLPSYLYGKGYKKGTFAPYVSPEHPDILKALPPCFLVTSKNDHLQHYTLQYEKAMVRQGVTHSLLNFPEKKELTHAFSVFKPDLKESDETIKAISDYFMSLSATQHGGTYELR